MVHPVLISGSLVEKIRSIGCKIKKELRGSRYVLNSIKSPFFIADWIVALKKIFQLNLLNLDRKFMGHYKFKNDIAKVLFKLWQN